MNPQRFYRPPGDVGIASLIVIVPLGLLAAAILALIYGFATYYIPFIYLNFLLTIGFGFVLGLALGMLSVKFKFPSRKFGGLMAVGVGCFAVYAAWVCWILAVSEREAFMVSPLAVFEVIQLIAEEGGWTLFGGTPRGIVLYLIWLIEAGIIVGGAWIVYLGAVSNPYCVNCSQWADETVILSPLTAIANPDDFSAQLQAENYAVLDELNPAAEVREPHSKLTLSRCARCGNLNVLTAATVSCSVDKEGNAQFTDTPVCSELLVNEDAVTRLEGVKQRVAASEEANETAPEGGSEAAGEGGEAPPPE